MEFLKSVTSKQALDIIGSFHTNPESEAVDLDGALNRILARGFVSQEDIPPFHRSLVDGFAVKTKDVQGAKETNPAFLQVTGAVRVGEQATAVLNEGQAVEVSTGAMIPEGADAVVMEEYVRRLAGSIEVTRAGHRGENICFLGEDIKKGDPILRSGKRLSPFDLGALAALGISSLSVYRAPRVAVISSGDEIVSVDQVPPLGKVRDINRYTVSSLIRKQYGVPCFLGIARDEEHDVAEKLQQAAEHDMILISGGSSKGERDLVTDVITSLGGILLFHGINIKPGKPTIFGSLWGKPVFGLPGHPVSCAVIMFKFVLPLLNRLEGGSPAEDRKVVGTLTANVPSSHGVEEYVRVELAAADDDIQVSPIFAKSSVISSLSRASGYLVVPEGVEGFERGERVEVYLFE